MIYRRLMIILLAVLLLLCYGCEAQPSERSGMVKGSRAGYTAQAASDGDADQKGTEDDTKTLEEDLYRILSIQTKDSVIRFENLNNGKSLQYAYNGATNILDKNANITTIDKLCSGLIVQLGISEKTDKLTDVKINDSKWVHTDINNFSLDAERDVLTVGQTDYALEDDLKVFSGNEQILLSEISQEDTLTLVGEDKGILSIIVSNGHGTIKLENTDLFLGGWLTVGKRVSREITKDMEFEIAEGTYTLAAASPDGYGDSTEITVSGGEVTQVDLNELKGEGPKYCRIVFTVNAENPRLYLNGDRADLSQPIDLKYGIYNLKVEADGYENWNKKLMVSSASAAISIELEASSNNTQSADAASGDAADNTASNDSSGNTATNNSTSTGNTTTNNTGRAGSLAGSIAGGGSSSNSSGSASNNTSNYTATGKGTVLNDDTLSTISSLIDILTNKSSSDNDSE